MQIVHFSITEEQRDKLLSMYPKLGNNGDIGKHAVMIVELYFKSKYPTATFIRGGDADLKVSYSGKTERFEIKGTESPDVAWNQLKVSSTQCYNDLVAGMTLIRVTNIRKTDLTLYFMKYGEDFTMAPEPRWTIKKIK